MNKSATRKLTRKQLPFVGLTQHSESVRFETVIFYSVRIGPLQLGNYFFSTISSFPATIRIDNSRMHQEIKRFRLSSEVQSQNTLLKMHGVVSSLSSF